MNTPATPANTQTLPNNYNRASAFPTPRSSWAAAGWTGPLRVLSSHPGPSPGKNSAIGGAGNAQTLSRRRNSDDALVSKGLDLLGPQLVPVVAVAQLAIVSTAPAPNSAVGGEGEAVEGSSRHSDDAPASQRLHLLGHSERGRRYSNFPLPIKSARPLLFSRRNLVAVFSL